MDAGLIVLIVLFSLIAISLFFSFVPLRLLKAARAEGIKLKMSALAGMRLRKTNQALIVINLIKAHKAGIDLTPQMLEYQHIMRGSVNKVVDSLITAKAAGIPFEFKRASAIDIAGGDTLEFIRNLSKTNKIYTPEEVAAAAADYMGSLDKDTLKSKSMQRIPR